MKYLALVLSSCFLIACGGGGGGGGSGGSGSSGNASASTLAAVSLSKYAGAWSVGCNGHDKETLAIADAGNGGYSTTLTQEVFADDRCAGAVVATGAYGQPMTTMTGIRTVPNAVIAMNGGTVVDTVDLVTVTAAVAQFAWSGSGLTSSSFGNGTTTATITYNNGSVTLTRHAVNGETTQGALLLRNGVMYTLQPDAGSTTHFSVTGQYTQ